MDGALVPWPPKIPEDPALFGTAGWAEPDPKTNGAAAAVGAGAEVPLPPAVNDIPPEAGAELEPPELAPKVNDEGADTLPAGWGPLADANGLFTEPAENVNDAPPDPDPN